MAPPTGLLIGRDARKPNWRVGKKIGEGVCGTVHELKEVKSDEKWAIKLTPLPAGEKGITAKKTIERNANLLNMEKLMYTAQLNRLRGSFIPKIPSSKGPPEFGEAGGFRYLVMELMEGSLWDVIPALISSAKRGGGRIPFGAVAVRLLDCMEAIHQHNLLFVDVKPENFMLSHEGTSLSSKIRMIDLGLLQDMRRVGGMRPNESGKGMVGTPLYASLNVHAGNTVSARDDLEAVGYVIAELILALLAVLRGETGKEGHHLPWSHGSSDEEIHNLKQQELTSTRSTFFSGMSVGGNDHVEQNMREYFSNVQNLSYKAKPDYETLRGLLSQLDIVVVASAKKKAAATRKPTPAKAAPVKSLSSKKTAPSPVETTVTTRRSSRSSSGSKRPSPRGDDDDDDIEITVRIRRPRTAAAATIDISLDEEEDDDDASEGGTEESMDWEVVQDENKEPSDGPMLGAKLLFTEGPHKGESITLIKDQNETVVLGRRPSVAADEVFTLKDKTAEADHAKIILQASKRLQTVDVLDLKTKAGTYVNGKLIKSGKDQKAFRNDSIQIGSSKLKVITFNNKKKSDSAPAAAAAKKAARAPAEAPAADEDVVMQETDNAANGHGPSLKIEFIEGPHKNTEVFFQQGVLEKLTLGSNPTAKSGETFELAGSVDANHARLELNVKRNFASLIVYDLKSKGGTFVKGEAVKKGKDHMAFRGDSIRLGEHLMVVKSA